MAEKDITQKLLTDIDEVFADIYNNLCFNGENIIKPDDLSNTSVTNAFISKDKTRGLISDVSKVYKNSNLTLALLNIENQSTEDKDMPFRIIGYEGAKYNSQLISGSDERYAVTTLVLNFNTEKRWGTPKSIKESLKNRYPKELDEYINDYKINVIDVAFMEKEEIDRLGNDLRILCDYFYQIRTKNEYVVPEETGYLKYPAQLLATISAISGDKNFETAYNEHIEKIKKGPVKMIDIMETYVGTKKAREEGKTEQAKETAINLKNMNMDEETIAKAVGRDTETVKKWLSFK